MDSYNEMEPIYSDIWLQLLNLTNNFKNDEGSFHIEDYNSNIILILRRYYENVVCSDKEITYSIRKIKE